MKTKLFLCNLFVLITTIVYPQNNTNIRFINNRIKYSPFVRNFEARYVVDRCDLFVTYDFSYVVDTATMKKYRDVSILEIGDNLNRFYGKNSEICDSLTYHFFKTSKKGFNPTGWLEKDETALYRDIYTYPKINERMASLRVNYTEYQYTEQIDKLDWKILPDVDTIVGYVCYKAETEFRERKWYAWFSMELPFNFGPWKLNGLPGLILKAEDTEGLFAWKAIGIEQPDNHFIYNYSKDIKTTTGSKHKIVKCKRKDVAKFWQRQWVAPTSIFCLLGGGEPVLKHIDSNGNVKPLTINMNDLPDMYYPKLELDL